MNQVTIHGVTSIHVTRDVESTWRGPYEVVHLKIKFTDYHGNGQETVIVAFGPDNAVIPITGQIEAPAIVETTVRRLVPA